MWNIVNELKERRMEKHLSQRELGDQLQAAGFKITHQQISKWEKDSHMPVVSNALAIAHVLGVNVEDIWFLKRRQ